jgi:hypothetical protein
MATPTLSSLATQSTYKVYICDKDGAKGSSNGIIANLDNTPNIRRVLLEHAITNRPLVYESTTYGYNDKNISAAASHYQYFLGDGSSAEGTVPADALDITPYITNGFKTALYPDANDIALAAGVDNISGGRYTYIRRGNIQVLRIDTEGETATDSLYNISESNNQVADRDILIIVGKDPSRVISIYDHTVTATDPAIQNICLENATSFGTGSVATYSSTNYDKSSLTLMWDANISLWIEVNRSPKSVITETKLRDANVNIPIKGTKITTITGADVVEVTSGVDPGILYFTGTVDIGSSNYIINVPTGGALEGDKYIVKWDAALTTTGVVTIFGKQLTSAEASGGKTNLLEIKTIYANGAWTYGVIMSDSSALEPALDNPSTNGMILTSTAAGVRSWADAPSGVNTVTATYDFALHGTAISTIDIGTELIPAGAIILLDQCIIEMHTALAVSGSVPTIAVGVGTSGAIDVDNVHDETNFNASPFSSATTVTRTSPAGSGTVIKTSDTVKATIAVTIAAHATLNAGKFTVHVPYIA